MVIKDLRNKRKLGYGESLNVYVIYWVNGKRYFLASPKNHKGFIVYSEQNVEIVDYHLGENMVLTKSSGGTEMILHSSLEKDGFVEKLLDDGQGNYDEFVNRLGHEP
jgi:hypothetical protein